MFEFGSADPAFDAHPSDAPAQDGGNDVTGVVIHMARAELIRRAAARGTGNCFRLLAGAAILVSELASGCTSWRSAVSSCAYFGRS